MPQVTTPKQLFKHELQDMYYAEKTLATTLPSSLRRRPTPELSRAFTAHEKETEKHVSNLEKVFKHIGLSGAGAHRAGDRAGSRRSMTSSSRRTPRATAMRNAGSSQHAAGAERCEIAAYTGLGNQGACSWRAGGAVELLQEDLPEEQGGAEGRRDDLEAPAQGLERATARRRAGSRSRATAAPSSQSDRLGGG